MKILCAVLFICLYVLRDADCTCSDEISVCSSTFSVKQQTANSTETCSLANEFVTCVTILKSGCGVQGNSNIDGGIGSLHNAYGVAPYNCTLDVTSAGVDRACITMFDNCGTVQVPQDPCSLPQLLEACVAGAKAYCSDSSLTNATVFIEQEKIHRTQTHGCDFGNMTTTPAALATGAACYTLFETCKSTKLPVQPSDLCLAVPVYQDCLENATRPRCDIQSYSVVQQYVATFISDNKCDTTTTSSTTALTTQLKTNSSILVSTAATTTSSTIASQTTSEAETTNLSSTSKPLNASYVTSKTTRTSNGSSASLASKTSAMMTTPFVPTSASTKETANTTRPIYEVVSVSESNNNPGDLFLDFGDAGTSVKMNILVLAMTCVLSSLY